MRKKIFQTGAVIHSSIILIISFLAIYRALMSLSLTSLTGVFALLLMVLPLRKLYLNFDGISEYIEEEANKEVNRITILLFFLSSAVFFMGFSVPVIDLLNLSFRISTPIFFPIKLLIPEPFSGIIFQYSRLYLNFIFLQLFSSLGQSVGKLI